MSKRKPKAAARELAAIVAEIHEAFRNDTASVIRRGSLLIEAKAQLKHGRWLPWLDENFDMDERTAQRAMSAAKFAAKYDSAVVFNLSVEALYALGGEVHKNGLHWEHYARGYLRYAPPVVTAAIEEAKTKLVSLKRLNAIASELTSDPAPQTIEEMEAEIEAEAAEEEQRAAQGQAEADAILDGSPPELPPIEMPKRELPAKVKVNGQPTNTADFSPAAQAQIVAALADKQAEHVIANLPGSWDLQPSDDADASAENGGGPGCNYDPTDPLPGDTYSSIWERQVDVACQTVEFVVTNLALNLKNNLKPKGYRTKKKQLEAIQVAAGIWTQLVKDCSRLLDENEQQSTNKAQQIAEQKVSKLLERLAGNFNRHADELKAIVRHKDGMPPYLLRRVIGSLATIRYEAGVLIAKLELKDDDDHALPALTYQAPSDAA